MRSTTVEVPPVLAQEQSTPSEAQAQACLSPRAGGYPHDESTGGNQFYPLISRLGDATQ
jgi:hypothetical protein